jgi:hypothetical protein
MAKEITEAQVEKMNELRWDAEKAAREALKADDLNETEQGFAELCGKALSERRLSEATLQSCENKVWAQLSTLQASEAKASQTNAFAGRFPFMRAGLALFSTLLVFAFVGVLATRPSAQAQALDTLSENLAAQSSQLRDLEKELEDLESSLNGAIAEI